MKINPIILALATLPVVADAQVVDSAENNGSLVPKNYRPAFTTRAARRAGDIVTIIISESSVASFQAATTATKKDSSATGPNRVPFLDFLRVGLVETLLRPGATAANSSVSGFGSTNQSGRFSARMAAVVKSVLPNGTMVVEGTRQVKVNRETQALTLTGLIRFDDVRPDNTILSENIANAEIRSEGIGLVYDRQRKGLLTKVLDWLF